MRAALKQAGFAEVQTLQFPAATYLSGWWTGMQAETEGSLESRHSTARMCARMFAPGDEAVRLTFSIDCKPVESRSWVRHPCFAVQAKTGENQPDFPPESLLKDKQEAECQDRCLLAHGQQGVYSSYTPMTGLTRASSDVKEYL